MTSRILVAIDASPRAASVLRAALAIGGKLGARVHPLRVISVPPEFPPAAAGAPADPLPAVLETQAREELARLFAFAAPGAEFERPLVRSGVPWQAILRAADETDAQLIVIGSNGYHGWDRVLGTTTLDVLKESSRNVLVVQQGQPIG